MTVKVGIGVVVYHNDNVLLGKRKNSHGDGTWALPGGHLEHGETPGQCAIREIAEETALTITNVKRGPWASDVFDEEGKHYITLFMLAPYQGGEVKRMLPASWRVVPHPA